MSQNVARRRLEGEEQIHTGYEYESGMFARARNWVDLAPWVALLRVLRLIASPTAVALATVGWLITRWAFVTLVEINSPTDFPEVGPNAYPSAFVFFTSAVVGIELRDLVWFVIVALVVWIPIAALLTRQGAALTAGRTLPDLGQSVELLAARWWRCYLIPLVLTLCVVTFWLLLLVVRVPSMLLSIGPVSTATGWLMGVLVIPAGLLAFGALVAIPLAVAAMMVEQDPDPIDSLSRGYEYLLRRPLNLLWYTLICVAIGWAFQTVFTGVETTSDLLVRGVASVSQPDPTLADSASFVVSSIWIGAQITLQLGLLGGVYLLLRRDAGGQHVEEFWTPKPKPVESLPELPEKAYE
ncbi:MAG: hypothetical protein AAFX06_21435 [Planctomycetota bacterium]